MSPLWCNFDHWLHWKLPKHFLGHSVTTISLPRQYFCFSAGFVLSVVSCFAVPLDYPMNFRLDQEKEVTASTVDFLWDSVNEGAWRMQGFFKGYKVGAHTVPVSVQRSPFHV